ncbi:MAG: hypothetical protein N2322_07920, partial [Terrimicrobiaceae bacterium]|nr:hypothetical protein [Terrimicrobiaceae bacterium]
MPTVAQTAFAALDFESTGASSQSGDHPVQVGIAILEDWAPQWELGFMSRIAAEATVEQETWCPHGMEAPAPAEAPRLIDLWPQFKARLAGRWLLAHGAATERRFLRAFPFHGFGPWVDTLK